MKKTLLGALITASALLASTQADAALARPPVVQRDLINRGVLAVSDDGRFALTADPLMGMPDELVNLATNGRVALKFKALHAHLTTDGSAMVFQTDSKLVAGDTNGVFDIYRYVFATKVFTRIVLPALPASLKTCWEIDGLLDVSGNGKVFALQMGNGCFAAQNVFIFDTVSRTWHVPDKLFSDFTVGMTRSSNDMKLSADGHTAVWITMSHTTFRNEAWVYHWTATASSKVLASAQYTGAAPTVGNTSFPDISPDGLTVSFRSTATNLVKGLTTVKPRVYVRKLATKVTTMITDHESTYDALWGPALTANGAAITLLEDRPTTFSGHVVSFPQPILYYVASKANVMLDQPAGTARPNNFSRRVMAAGVAHKIVFTSMATNFIAVSSPANKAVDRVFLSTYF